MLISYNECIKYNNNIPFNGVIHIGAHLGEECIDYKNNGVKKVIWVEANSKLLEPLVKKTQSIISNDMMDQKYFNVLLSSTNNEDRDFYVTNNGQSSSMLKLGTHKNYYPDIYVTEIQKTTTIRFDKLIEDHKINIFDYDFINLDVQGAELEVLKGFGDIIKNKNIKAIYSEVNFEELYVGAPHIIFLSAFLEEYGFKLVKNINTGQMWGDALYLRQ